MKLRGPLIIGALVFATFFVTYVGTSSATTLCTVQLTECPSGDDLPVPSTISATMTSAAAVFAQSPGATCKTSSLELETTSNLGFWPKPLVAKIISWKFSGCSTSCTTVTVTSSSNKAEFEAIEDPTFSGDGTLKILSPEIKLSGCPLGQVCTDSASSIVLKVNGGSPMKWIANSVSMGIGGASCGTGNALFSAEYSVTTKLKGLWLEPVP